MRIKLSEGFRYILQSQVAYIARDKPQAARKFKNRLLKEIKDISKMPFAHRRSIYFDSDSIRDLIFMGYVITFRINGQKDVIEVFGLTKWQEDLNA
ncbi:type II toxin-antitoxin system RelE/ParE family toxin [Olivibacter sitiensis]|uniref:type II toxin-antitoxin system RelE/ParE family toxin n=1 Tax=Olivibacter sitiensis TaxID=376470 RepID=UPI0003F6CD54|nr:type II toxin-antitoxin system RelE/ParE family toxin [Olivibacter sitiensis]